ncbi:unnamed protein product, partial [Mesorhabditis spiculigera]
MNFVHSVSFLFLVACQQVEASCSSCKAVPSGACLSDCEVFAYKAPEISYTAYAGCRETTISCTDTQIVYLVGLLPNNVSTIVAEVSSSGGETVTASAVFDCSQNGALNIAGNDIQNRFACHVPKP